MHFVIALVGKNLLKDQSNLPLVIISLFLITFSRDYKLISWGEIWCWSLLGLKGLRLNRPTQSSILLCTVVIINFNIARENFNQSEACFWDDNTTLSWNLKTRKNKLRIEIKCSVAVSKSQLAYNNKRPKEAQTKKTRKGECRAARPHIRDTRYITFSSVFTMKIWKIRVF